MGMKRVLCFGEVLWDCLPRGRLPGGAPVNVAYHLKQLGAEPLVVSAVGDDVLGSEMLAHLEKRGLSTELIARHPHVPTGTVSVALDDAGQPTYTIRPNVAWDEITVPEEAWQKVENSDAIVFGSLAARSATNRTLLDRLLAIPNLLRVMDVNLRPPFDDRERALALAARADWLKLNEHELGFLTGMATGEKAGADLSAAVRALAEMTAVEKICVTRGAEGAVMWAAGRLLEAGAPPVKVCDTIGAGDAFTAALVEGVLPGSQRGLQETLEEACALGALVASLSGGQPEYDPTRIRGRTATADSASQ